MGVDSAPDLTPRCCLSRLCTALYLILQVSRLDAHLDTLHHQAAVLASAGSHTHTNTNTTTGAAAAAPRGRDPYPAAPAAAPAPAPYGHESHNDGGYGGHGGPTDPAVQALVQRAVDQALDKAQRQWLSALAPVLIR